MTWLEGENAARIPLVEDAVLRLVRRHFGDLDAVYVSSDVPRAKELAARRAYAAHLTPGERILALYEARGTRGSQHPSLGPEVHHGFVLTAEQICWKNPGEPACALHWSDLDPDRLLLDGTVLSLGEDAVLVVDEPEVTDACANTVTVLALSARNPSHDTIPDGIVEYEQEESGVVRTVAATRTSSDGWNTIPLEKQAATYGDYASHAQLQDRDYSCWHCFTPLHETTPECAFCGATPKQNGWLRTA